MEKCVICTKTVRNTLLMKSVGLVCNPCEKKIKEQIIIAYQIQQKWEQGLSTVHKLILEVLRKSANLTVFDINRETGIPTFEIQKILVKFDAIIERKFVISQGKFVYNFKDVQKAVAENLKKGTLVKKTS